MMIEFLNIFEKITPKETKKKSKTTKYDKKQRMFKNIFLYKPYTKRKCIYEGYSKSIRNFDTALLKLFILTSDLIYFIVMML